MHFSTDQQDTTTVFRLKEEKLDSSNAGQLKAEFLILAQPDVDTLIVDLSEVRHIDSAGISALLLAQRQMSVHGGDVRLVGPNEAVQSMLRVTQLDRIFSTFNTIDEALDAEPSFGDDDDEEDIPLGAAPLEEGVGAPSIHQIKAGAIAAGGSLGAATLARIMMSPYEQNLDELNLLALGEEEEPIQDELDDDDDFADDLEDDDLADDTEDEDEDDAEEEDVEEIEEDDLLEDDDLEDDDFDDEELEEDEEDDF
jgi:anti-sigma B factor antagonist